MKTLSPKIEDTPPQAAIRPNNLKKWIRSQFLSPYLYKIPKNAKTLDLASGWGFSFEIIPGLYGIEFDPECVAYCQKKGWNVAQGNILEPLPYEEDFFDYCFTHDVLEHFELKEIPDIFANVYQVLKPGGYFINIIPNKLGYEHGIKIKAGHKHFILPEEIIEIGNRNYFDLEETKDVPFPSFINSHFTHGKKMIVLKKKGGQNFLT